MSNRILWILIILFFIIWWYSYYKFSYIPRIQVEEQKKLEEANKIENEKLIKKVELVKIDKIDNKKTNLELINDIIENEKNYKTFKFNNWLKAYFKEVDSGLDLYYNYDKIWSFKLVFAQYLRADIVSATDNDLYIEVWWDKYYYNFNTKELNNIKLNIDVLYTKKLSNNELILVTSKWSFKYNIFSSKIEYFSFFDDFVNFNDWYIWIIKSNDNIRLNNLWINANNKNIILYYNPYTKEKKVLYSTSLDYDKFYMKDNKFYLERGEQEFYILDNI